LKEEVEDFIDPKDIPIEEGREIIIVKSKDMMVARPPHS